MGPEWARRHFLPLALLAALALGLLLPGAATALDRASFGPLRVANLMVTSRKTPSRDRTVAVAVLPPKGIH